MLSFPDHYFATSAVQHYGRDNGLNFNDVKVLSDSEDWGWQYHPHFDEEVVEVQAWDDADTLFVAFVSKAFKVLEVDVYEGSYE